MGYQRSTTLIWVIIFGPLINGLPCDHPSQHHSHLILIISVVGWRSDLALLYIGTTNISTWWYIQVIMGAHGPQMIRARTQGEGAADLGGSAIDLSIKRCVPEPSGSTSRSCSCCKRWCWTPSFSSQIYRCCKCLQTLACTSCHTEWVNHTGIRKCAPSKRHHDEISSARHWDWMRMCNSKELHVHGLCQIRIRKISILTILFKQSQSSTNGRPEALTASSIEGPFSNPKRSLPMKSILLSRCFLCWTVSLISMRALSFSTDSPFNCSYWKKELNIRKQKK